MKRQPITTKTARVHPLLQPCTCCFTPGRLCLTCARWHRHYRTVCDRRASWGLAR